MTQFKLADYLFKIVMCISLVEEKYYCENRGQSRFLEFSTQIMALMAS